MENELSIIKLIEREAAQIPGVISLAQGVPTFSSAEPVRRAVIQAVKKNKVDRYSAVTGLEELRLAIAQDLRTEKMNYDVDREIMVTAGAIEALSATLIGLVSRGDEVIFPSPAYPSWFKIAQMVGAKVKVVRLNEKLGWQLDVNDIKKVISRRTRLLILGSPNNPTGNVYSKNQILEILMIAEKYGFIVVLDDIYRNIYFGQGTLFNPCSDSRFKNHIIRIVSFSKDFALSGWRIGYLHSSEKNLLRILPTHDNLINCAPVVSQYAALAAIKNKKVIIGHNLDEYRKRRELMGKSLEQLSSRLNFTWPKGGYYFFPRIKGLRDDKSFCFELLRESKLALVPGTGFGPGGEGHVRLCFGRSEIDIKEGMGRLKRHLGQFGDRL